MNFKQFCRQLCWTQLVLCDERKEVTQLEKMNLLQTKWMILQLWVWMLPPSSFLICWWKVDDVTFVQVTAQSAFLEIFLLVCCFAIGTCFCLINHHLTDDLSLIFKAKVGCDWERVCVCESHTVSQLCVWVDPRKWFCNGLTLPRLLRGSPGRESDCNILYQLPAAGAKQSLTSQNSDRKLFCAKVLTFLRDQKIKTH